MIKVIIDPRCKFNYATYYISGASEAFGVRNITFDVSPFLEFQYNFILYEQGLFMVFEQEGGKRNVYVDFHDSDTILEEVYCWCDVYAKINVSKEINLTEKSKLLPIGPGFSVNPGSFFGFSVKTALNLITLRKYIGVSFKSYVSDYLYPYVKRLTYHSYRHSSPVQDYIFSMSTLWYDEMTDITTNKYRACFIKESRKQCRFEGGFFFIPRKSVIQKYPPYKRYREEYADYLFFKRIGHRRYVENTKKSAIVFNTPSVCGCHGWKLAEYLCMGKAIISTPLNNLMPGGFEPGTHYYVVHNESEIEEAIRLLLNDKTYRSRLEKSAKKYFDAYLSPKAVMMRIYNKF